MNENEKTLALFTTRMRQMILRFNELKQEKQQADARVAELGAQIDLLKRQLAQSQHDFNALKMARMIEVSDGDLEGAQKKIARLIRDVNKCITLLSEK